MKSKSVKYEVEKGRVFNVLPAEMVANIPDGAIERAYEGSFMCDEMTMFEGMLYMMCFDYIKTKGLKSSDAEYKHLIENLAKLSSFYNEDSGLRLTPDDVQYWMENDIIPIDLDNYTHETVKEGPVYIRKNRFTDIIRLAYSIMEHYEMPENPDRPTQGNMDGYENLCYGAADWCAESYRTYKSFQEYMRKYQAEKVTVNQHKADNSLDFDL